MPIASGVNWVEKFPTRADIGGCVSPFRENLEAFVAALKSANAAVTINATAASARARLPHAYLLADRPWQ